MTHKDIEKKLDDYDSGLLSADESAAVESHLKLCLDCREQLSLHRFFKDTDFLGDGIAISDHPNPEELISFASGEDDLSPLEIDAISHHVDQCQECQEHVAFVEKVEFQENQENVIPTRAWYEVGSAHLTYAAAAMVLLLLYPAYQGLNLEGNVGGISNSHQIWSPGNSLIVVSPQSRGFGEKANGLINHSLPYLQVVLTEPMFFQNTNGDDKISIVLNRIENGVGELILEMKTDYSSISSPQWDGSIILMLPSERLIAGEYELGVTVLKNSKAKLMREFTLQ